MKIFLINMSFGYSWKLYDYYGINFVLLICYYFVIVDSIFFCSYYLKGNIVWRFKCESIKGFMCIMCYVYWG